MGSGQGRSRNEQRLRGNLADVTNGTLTGRNGGVSGLVDAPQRHQPPQPLWATTAASQWLDGGGGREYHGLGCHSHFRLPCWLIITKVPARLKNWNMVRHTSVLTLSCLPPPQQGSSHQSPCFYLTSPLEAPQWQKLVHLRGA